MKQNIDVLTLSVIAATTIAKGQLVTLDGNVAITEKDAHGVAVYDAAVGDVFPVIVLGTAAATAAADITAGQRLQVATEGEVAPHVAGVPVAIAVESAATGEFVEVLICSAGIAGTTV